MYRNYRQNKKETLKHNKSYEGETIEQKVFRVTNNKEPIKDGAPLTYTDRSEGVKPSYNIRTDRWDVAADAMDKVTKAIIAKRDGKPLTDKQVGTETKMGKDGKPDSVGATDNT